MTQNATVPAGPTRIDHDRTDATGHTDATGRGTAGPADDGRHAFDFLAGTWHVRHRKLADMLDPACAEWVEFDGVQWARPTLGGLGNVDNLTIERLPDGRPYQGMSIRLFDVESGEWRIWWASTNHPGHLDPPVTGRWNGTRGVFRGEDVAHGTPISVRFVWDVFDADTARWEQEFSFDGGQTWVHNWRMSFTRIGQPE